MRPRRTFSFYSTVVAFYWACVSVFVSAMRIALTVLQCSAGSERHGPGKTTAASVNCTVTGSLARQISTTDEPLECMHAAGNQVWSCSACRLHRCMTVLRRSPCALVVSRAPRCEMALAGLFQSNRCGPGVDVSTHHDAEAVVTPVSNI